MKRILLTLVLTLLCAAPALAQTPSPARMQAAAQLVDVMDMEKNLRETTDALIEQQMEQNPVMAQFEDIMRDFMARALNWSELRDDYVRMYAEVYTESELRQLRDLYRTPLGQRLLSTLPTVAAKSSEISNRRLQKHLPEMQQQIMQRMMASDSTGKKKQ